jgi:hypothetical protein
VWGWVLVSCVMFEPRRVESLSAFPHKCLATGATRGPVIDTGLTVGPEDVHDGDVRVYLREEVIASLAGKCVPPLEPAGTVASLRAELDQMRAELDVVTAERDQLERTLADTAGLASEAGWKRLKTDIRGEARSKAFRDAQAQLSEAGVQVELDPVATARGIKEKRDREAERALAAVAASREGLDEGPEESHDAAAD